MDVVLQPEPERSYPADPPPKCTQADFPFAQIDFLIRRKVAPPPEQLQQLRADEQLQAVNSGPASSQAAGRSCAAAGLIRGQGLRAATVGLVSGGRRRYRATDCLQPRHNAPVGDAQVLLKPR
eukprot:COSAG01_NODE_34498_length_546_cov_2.069351_1_plen_122_part_01